MEHFPSTVLQNYPICEKYYCMRLLWPDQYPAPLPGQFLTIRPPAGTRALLRRPFAVSSYSKGDSTIEVIYERRGEVTRYLSTMQTGDQLDLLAPLGKAFPAATEDHRPVLLAGGIGMGPMFFLAEALSALDRQPLLLLGARDASLIPDIPILEQVETIIATDDGSKGFHGTTIDALVDYERSGTGEKSEYFACGPMPMLSALAVHAENAQRQCWVSIEQTMGCAVGACMGCVIPIHDPKRYARVCTEGPIFDSREIVWT